MDFPNFIVRKYGWWYMQNIIGGEEALIIRQYEKIFDSVWNQVRGIHTSIHWSYKKNYLMGLKSILMVLKSAFEGAFSLRNRMKVVLDGMQN